MIVNIYGVGRSGTKAVQSYLAYHLALKYDRIWINYEPFRYLNRFGGINFKAFWYDQKIPIFTNNKASFTKRQIRFIKSLVSNRDVVITKFIRANGRLVVINDLMQPDFTFVVVRDLYQVLSSVGSDIWDFFRVQSVGFPLSRYDFFLKIMNDADKAGLIKPSHKKYIDNAIASNDRFLMNAFYWYWQNKYLLINDIKGAIILKYKELDKIEDILQSNPLFANIEVKSIKDDLFKGRLIENSLVLKTTSKRIKLKLYFNLINEFFFYFMGRKFKWSLNIPMGKIGEESIIREHPKMPIKSLLDKIRINISPTDLLDELNNEINELVSRYYDKQHFT